MPILAAVAIAAGATAITVSAGVALATAVNYVGVGMSVVGAVTKNKNFTKVGAVMGLAGGVMNIAGVGTTAAAEVAATGAETAIEAEAFDAAMASQGAAELAVTQADPFLAATGTGAAAPVASAASSAAEVASVANAPPFSAELEGMAQPAVANSGPSGLLNATQTPAMQQPAMAVDVAAETAAKVPSFTNNVMSSNFMSNMPTGAATPPPASGISSWWSSKSVPEKEMWMKAAASGVGSMFQGWSEEQKLALQREIANQNQGNIDMKQANLNAQPTVQFRPVGGYPQRTGLLGSNIVKVGG